MRAPKLPRGRRSGIATLAALVVLAACVLVAVAAVQIRAGHDSTVLGRTSDVASRLRTHDWGDVAVLVAAIVAGVLGLVLVIGGLVPARRGLLRLTDLDENTISGVTRPGLARDLTAVVGHVDGVSSAKVSVRRRSVRVTARPALRDTSGLGESIRTAVGDRLGTVGPDRDLDVHVRLREAKA